jgi:hypothetical protein
VLRGTILLAIIIGRILLPMVMVMVTDEGMTNRPSIFAYLVFGPGGITVEGIARPIKIAA